MPETMQLETAAPDYLIALADIAAARKTLRDRQYVPARMEAANSDHAAEVREKTRTSGYPLITNGQAARRGSGSGYEVIYRRCRCDGFEVECFHDPTDSPYTPENIAAAKEAVTKAEKALAKAEAHLTGVDPSFDCFENARSVGARFVWWPLDKGRDPRKFRYRGQPLTDDETRNLGPHSLRRALTNGAIIEVEQ